SFDHTTGRLVIDGTATVSADGLSVHTDPGQGVTHPGWHGLPPPGTTTTMRCPPTRPQFVQPFHDSDVGKVGIDKDYLFTMDGQAGQISFAKFQTPLQQGGPCQGANAVQAGIQFKITLDDNTAAQFLNGLQSQTFELKPGDTKNINFSTVALAPVLRTLAHDELFGVKVNVQILSYDLNLGQFVPVANQPDPFYIYRYLDASDDNPNDGILKFPDAVNDGQGGAVRTRIISFIGPADAAPD